MAIGINDLDDDDDVMEVEPQQFVQTHEEPTEPEGDVMSDFLRTRGIDDMSSINFEDEDGNITTRSWNDLSREEQFNILNTPLNTEDNNEPQFSEEEISLLNQIRQSNMSPSEFINSLKGETEVQEPQYRIDDLSDDEVYLLDLESRVGELSDDEAANALNLAKQNEEFYKKQIDGIRKEYKEREDFNNQQEMAQLEEQQRQAINNFNSIGELDLDFSDQDKEELADFMLSQDETGKNYLYQALQDPETLARAAWFILNGEEAFNSVTDYFKNQIKLVSENQYKKGLEDGKKGISSKPTVVIDNSKKKTHRTYGSINDLDDDE